MKKAYFVMGPESSGTRMMTQAIQSTKDFGVGGVNINNGYVWKAKWVDDSTNIIDSIKKAPDEIILVRSVPRGGWPNKKWPNIAEICQTLIENDYRVFPIIMSRYYEYTAKSQANRGHVPNENLGKEMIKKAHKYILDALKKVNLQFYLVEYEEFVTDPDYRRAVFKALNLDREPQMEFFNANEKYQKG